jgi:heptaprenyl diphosphate synthase
VNIGELLSLPELRKDLLRVDNALRLSVSSDDSFLTEVAAHLISAGGKRLRPSMALAAALTCVDGPVSDKVIQGAVSVELVHLGSLYHDDVMDEASTRRSLPSVNAQWGNFMAIVAGDYLLAKASSIAASLGVEIASLLAATIGELCEGQVREVQYGYDINRPVDAYEACISGKTASLLATAARIGAMTAGLPQNEIEALTTYGHDFGIAFQIRDDILDVIGTDEQLGKPAGNDLVEGVYTLPVIFALGEEAAGAELRTLLGGPIATPERDKARDIVRNSSGVPQAIATGRVFAKRATNALNDIRDSAMTRHLVEMADSCFDDLPTL